ncbi:uncharacterized protein BDV14DRAFT_82633 [Aspergillus stella-maris]|uniref:uncharacterized protein n=1 Tax=Aspergillus stella-maris TaxID=1810926 RepID=UPI003CCCF336
MLLAYWRTIPMKYQQANVPLAAPSPDGATASLAALWGNGKFIVKGCQDDQLTIQDLILGFSSNLSRTMLHRPSRTKIYGYEFMNLMMDSHKSELKKYHVSRQRQSWTPLLEHVNYLFCSNIGDAIRGYKGRTQDSPCNQLPKGKNWLAVSMHSLDKLNRRNGGDDCTMHVKSRRLSNQQFWELTGSPFQTCEHMEGSAITCWESSSLFQKVQTSQPGRSGKEVKHKSHSSQQQQQQSTNGAVVFGRPGKFTPYVYRIFQPPRSDYCPKPEVVGPVPSRADSPEPIKGAMAIA